MYVYVYTSAGNYRALLPRPPRTTTTVRERERERAAAPPPPEFIDQALAAAAAAAARLHPKNGFVYTRVHAVYTRTNYVRMYEDREPGGCTRTLVGAGLYIGELHKLTVICCRPVVRGPGGARLSPRGRGCYFSSRLLSHSLSHCICIAIRRGTQNADETLQQRRVAVSHARSREPREDTMPTTTTTTTTTAAAVLRE